MKNKSKLVKFISVLIVMILITGVSACNGSTTTQPAGTTTQNQEEIIEIEFMSWSNEMEIQGQQPMVDAMMEEHPNIRLKWTSVPEGYEDKLKTRLISGDAPDLINAATTAYFRMLAGNGLILPLDDLYKDDDDFDISKYPEKLLDAFVVDGNVYGLPKDNVPIVLFYNTDLFDTSQVPYPTDDWTWNDLRDYARELTLDTNNDEVTDQFGFSFRTDALAFDPTLMNGYGAPGLTNFNKGDKVTLTDPRNFEAFEFFQEIFVIDQSAPSPAAKLSEIDLFTAEKLAMLLGGSFYLPTIKDNMDNYAVAQMPKNDQGTRSQSLFTSGFSISAKTDYAEECWKAISFMSYGEGNRILASTGFGFPATSPQQYPDAFLTEDLKGRGGDAFVKAMEYQIPWNWGPNETEISNAYQTCIDTILTSTDNPQTVLENALANIEEIFAKE